MKAIKFQLLSLKKKIHIPTAICLILSIAVVSGLNYFYEDSLKNNYDSFFKDISDIEISHSHAIWYDLEGTRYCTTNMHYTNLFNETNERIDTILNETELDLIKTCKYGLSIWDAAFISDPNYPDLNFTDISSELGYKKRSNATELSFVFADTDLYNSSRFTNYFQIINGSSPKSPNEILIDYGTATKYGLNAGDTTNLSIRIGSMFVRYWRYARLYINLGNFSLDKITIAGIYVPQEYTFSLNQEDFRYSYSQDDYLVEKPYQENALIDKPAIFTYYNFSGPDIGHPVQNLFAEIKNTSYFGYLDRVITKSGYFLIYDRENIQYRKISSETKVLDVKIANITKQIPINMGIQFVLGMNLDNFLRDVGQTRTILQLMNLPIICFSIIFGLSFQNSFEKKRMEEIFFLRLKGVPIKTIRNQILSESCIVGIGEAILGDILGFALFYGYWFIVGEQFYNDTPSILLPFITLRTILLSFLFGIILNMLISTPLLRKIKKTHYDGFNRTLTSRYSSKNSEENEIFNDLGDDNDLPDQTDDSNELDNPFETYHNLSKFQKTPLKIKSNYTKLTFALFLLGIFSLLVYLLIYLSYNITLSDFFKDIVRFFIFWGPALELLPLLGMICLIVGISRIIIEEKPQIFAKLIQTSSYVFLKDLNVFVSLEIIGKRKWRNILMSISTISALLISISILFNSKFGLSVTFLTEIETDASLQAMLGTYEFYQILAQFLQFSLIIIAILVGIAEVLLFQENQVINKTLFIRGLDNKSFWKIMFFETTIIYVIGVFIGIIFGTLFGILIFFMDFVIKVENLMISPDLIWQNFLTITYVPLILQLAVLFVISSLIFYIGVKKGKSIESHQKSDTVSELLV
ncbi:hypothetical protein NEF87_003077 [Candidatus Lokiarchaeum ossiferum]|uniref:ABC3 transporter permease C-terminal domain-containing protein n=1 Tax=Candidatus Lokiarchaeum ossiferum TaxID=2951803 RepID=A0ABY6HWR5_9ARCH|nr:hypothetical protein NEF87_003077 [Candidatus Lokiarchaeum sp. B-35]